MSDHHHLLEELNAHKAARAAELKAWNELVIIEASFGSADARTDVTHAVRQHASHTAPGGTWEFPCTYDAMKCGDPAPGVMKYLRVQYVWGGTHLH
jgi:hypothetical protein